MKNKNLIFISDTHSRHSGIELDIMSILLSNTIKDPNDTILIHCGDISTRGYKWEVEEFMNWFASIPIQHKVMICGNHDFLFENEPEAAKEIFERFPSILYLQDSGVEIDGVNIWGSPVQPWFHDWAFNRLDHEIQKHWDLIPENTDVLITHGPPKGILDETRRGLKVGCPKLLKKIQETPSIKVHAFGHIHEASGVEEAGGVIYVNASNLDYYYEYKNPPTLIKI